MNCKKLCMLLLPILFLNVLLLYPTSIKSVDINTKEIQSLVIIDNDFGENYLMIMSKMELFGWNVTLAGPTKLVTSCPPSGSYEYEVDILFSDIDDICSYHCITILPGRDHQNLLSNKDNILGLIRQASKNNIVIAGWCRSVRVLAAADIINGRNVTGNDLFELEYEAAGATFIPNSGPIIDGNIVTTTRSLFHQNAMLLATAKAIGCYESNPPVIENPSVSKSESGLILFTIEIDDESGVLDVLVKFQLIDEAVENSTIPLYFGTTMNFNKTLNVYNCEIPNTALGNYNVSITVSDVFWNEKLYSNFTTINLVTDNLEINHTLITTNMILFTLSFITFRKKKRIE